MRRGPLADYSAEWVLRQASANGASGSIEFHTGQPLTLFVRSGRVCHGVEGVAASGFSTDPAAEPPQDEATARSRVVRLVAQAMRAADGWYYLDPIGHHDVTSPWGWDAAALVRDAHGREPTSLPPTRVPPTPPARPVGGAATSEPPAPTERVVRLHAARSDAPVTLGAEPWRIVCVLAEPKRTDELRQALGWPAARLDAALEELTRAGAIADEASVGVAPASQAPGSSPAPRTTAAPPRRDATRPAPPTVPPAPGTRAAVAAPVDRRGALRRLISSLKPA